MLGGAGWCWLVLGWGVGLSFGWSVGGWVGGVGGVGRRWAMCGGRGGVYGAGRCWVALIGVLWCRVVLVFGIGVWHCRWVV